MSSGHPAIRGCLSRRTILIRFTFECCDVEHYFLCDLHNRAAAKPIVSTVQLYMEDSD